MKIDIKQFEKAAAGILSIAVLSSTMVMTTVSTSSAKQIQNVSEAELAGMCARSNGNFEGSKNLFGNTVSSYSCVVKYPNGSAIVVSCHEDRGCEGNKYKKDNRGGPSIKVVLDQKLQNAEQLIAPTTPKKPSYLGKKLSKSASGKLMAN